jgi:uncharacterized protein (TIGR03067 family)
MLQGTWRVLGVESDGKTLAEESPEIKDAKVIFGSEPKLDLVTMVEVRDGEARHRRFTFELDSVKKPSEIKMLPFASGNDTPLRGIYEDAERLHRGSREQTVVVPP